MRVPSSRQPTRTSLPGHQVILTRPPDEFAVATLLTAINRQQVLFVWPLKLPSPDGKQNDWHRSALEAAEMAMTRWSRLKANMSLGAYDVFEATGDLPEPEWPELAFPDILKIAFRNHY